MNTLKRVSKADIISVLALSTAMPLYAAAQDQSGQTEQQQSQSQSGQAQPGAAQQGQSRNQGQSQNQGQPDQRAQGGNQSQQSANEDEQLARSDDQSRSRAEQQPNPYAQADDSWISISGTVDAVEPHSFTLDYGGGIVTVEMDDGDRDADGYSLLRGDQVTVYGLVDDDLFETTSVEASSVFVEKLGTYFYASSLDEEDYYVVSVPASLDSSSTALHGRVTEVSGDEFEIDAGSRSVTVDIDELPYDPLDDEGYQKIEVGDIVSVTGNIDDDFFEGREIKASTLTTLVEEVG